MPKLWVCVSKILMATEGAVRKGLQENGRGVFQALSWRDSKITHNAVKTSGL